jgi:hypothetical protein
MTASLSVAGDTLWGGVGLFNSAPSETTTAKTAIEMPAAIRPHSMTPGPDWSLAKRFMRSVMFCTHSHCCPGPRRCVWQPATKPSRYSSKGRCRRVNFHCRKVGQFAGCTLIWRAHGPRARRERPAHKKWRVRRKPLEVVKNCARQYAIDRQPNGNDFLNDKKYRNPSKGHREPNNTRRQDGDENESVNRSSV